MSALARTISTPTDPDGCRGLSEAKAPTEWIALPRAAHLLDVSEAHLRRVCSGKLASRGAAKQIRIDGTGGGKPVWHIHCSYDARLGREHVATLDESLGEVWASATDAQRHKALAKAKVLIAFRALIANPKVQLKSAFPSFLARMKTEHGIAPAQRTLYRWNEQCPPSSSPIAIGAALIDARTHTAGQSASEDAIDMFRGLYLTPAKMSVAQCYRMVEARAAKEHWSWPSLRTVQVNLDKWVDPQMATMAREGKDVWRRKFATPIHQNPDAFQAGECWEADHTRLDFFVRVQRGGKWTHDRPWLTCWMDRRSRRIVGWHIGLNPDSEAIRAALIRAFKDGMAIPSYAVMDNGKDFASEAIGGLTKAQRRNMSKADREQAERAWGGLLGQLGIEAHFNVPYNKDGKGRVERLMRTVHQTFDNTFDSYRGSESIKVPDEHIKKILSRTMELPTLERATAKFAEWVEWYNHRDEHNIEDLVDADGTTRISPAAFYEANIFRRSRLADDKVLGLLELTWSRELKVTRHGVSLKIGGKVVHYGGADPAVKAIVGTTVRVSYDPGAMQAINVWTTDGRFVARALMNSLHGGFAGDDVSREALKAGLRRQRDERKRIAQPIDRLAITGDTRQLAADEQRKRDIEAERAREAERRGNREAEDMPPVRLVATSLDDQAEQAEAARRRSMARRVAGSESDSMPAASTGRRPSIDDIFGDDGFDGFDGPDADADALAESDVFDAVFDESDDDAAPLRFNAIDALDDGTGDDDEWGGA